jgi:predicted nucleic acid-binding protein
MFLLDTNVLSESRKGAKADPGVREFLDRTSDELFLPVQVVGELLSGIQGLRLRGDIRQARNLEDWFQLILDEYAQHILNFDPECARTWGVLMGVNDQHIVDRQIAAIALVYNLTIVTRNTGHFAGTGVRLLNPFRGETVSSKPSAERRSQ